MSDTIFIVFDVTQQKSFDDTQKWLNSIKSVSQKSPEIFLVGAKVDQTKERVVAKRLAIQYARQNNMHFQEISVKNMKGIEELMSKATSYVINKKAGTPIKEESEKINSHPIEKQQEKSCATCTIF